MSDTPPAVVIAPYVPVTTRLSVGAWELIPFGALEGVVPESIRSIVFAHVGVYRNGTGRGARLGAVAVPRGKESATRSTSTRWGAYAAPCSRASSRTTR